MTEKNTEIKIDEEIQERLESIIDAAGLEIDVNLLESGNDIKYDLAGQDSEMLLSDGAGLLYAFNHLINQMYFRRLGKGRNIVLDSQHYRSERELELVLMADKAAEQARTTGRKLVLQPMNSAERRIIHLRLADEAGIRTESEGFGQNRRISILPA